LTKKLHLIQGVDETFWDLMCLKVVIFIAMENKSGHTQNILSSGLIAFGIILGLVILFEDHLIQYLF